MTQAGYLSASYIFERVDGRVSAQSLVGGFSEIHILLLTHVNVFLGVVERIVDGRWSTFKMNALTV